MKIEIDIDIRKGNFNPWHYKATMKVFGVRRFLTFANTLRDAKQLSKERIKALLGTWV